MTRALLVSATCYCRPGRYRGFDRRDVSAVPPLLFVSSLTVGVLAVFVLSPPTTLSTSVLGHSDFGAQDWRNGGKVELALGYQDLV